MDGEALIRGYLDRLDSASRALPARRREELRAEVSEHIDEALAERGARDEVAVRNVLERLGPPDEIVAADLREEGAAAPAAGRGETPGLGALEVVAILCLTIGGLLLPFVGPLVGLLFVWASRAWSTREKTVASAIVIGLLLLPLVGLRFGTGG